MKEPDSDTTLRRSCEDKLTVITENGLCSVTLVWKTLHPRTQYPIDKKIIHIDDNGHSSTYVMVRNVGPHTGPEDFNDGNDSTSDLRYVLIYYRFS